MCVCARCGPEVLPRLSCCECGAVPPHRPALEPADAEVKRVLRAALLLLLELWFRGRCGGDITNERES